MFVNGEKIIINDPDSKPFEAIFLEMKAENKLVSFKTDDGKTGTVGKRWVDKV